MFDRRSFLKTFSSLAVVGASFPQIRSWATETENFSIPGKEGMIVRSARFVDLETPPEFFNTFITPVQHFFVRNHMHEPSALDAREWKLSIGGEVERPYTLSIAELSKLESHTVTNTLECAGNGRSFHDPTVPGVQWGRGAVGTARSSGDA